MIHRRFWDELVNVERGSIAVATGTLQQVPTYAAVAGMTSLEASIHQISASPVPTELGILVGEVWGILINPDQIPDGAVIKEGDRIAKTDTGETFTVISAKRKKIHRVLLWDLTCERKTA